MIAAVSADEICSVCARISALAHIAGHAFGLGYPREGLFTAAISVALADKLADAGREEGTLALAELQEAFAQCTEASVIFALAKRIRSAERQAPAGSASMLAPLIAKATRRANLGAILEEFLSLGTLVEDEQI